MKIVLFDGECCLCNQSVQFIVKRDRKGRFQFASLQSPIGQNLLHKSGLPAEYDGMLFYDKNKFYHHSAAPLRICLYLPGFWKIFFLLNLVPKPIRDGFYHFVAKNRYRWFGKNDHCLLSNPELNKRFLE